MDAYLLPEKKASYPPCYRFNEGDVFIVDGFEMPAGFCPWAWADIPSGDHFRYVPRGIPQ